MSNDRDYSTTTVAIGCVVGLGVFTGLAFGIGAMTAMKSTSAGKVGVVRNGAPWDNKNVKEILQPGHSATYIGWWSDYHEYPATQSSYTITDDAKEGDQPGVDVVSVPSSDGVQMGIQGTLYFTLSTDKATLTAFDNKFGTRSFTYGGKSGNAYDGTEGWGIFMNYMVRPVINNAIRNAISTNPCAELIASCALVQNGGGLAVNPNGAPKSNANLVQVEKGINDALASDINSTLGGNYFTGIKFTINKVDLPPNVQTAVNDAQAAYAEVSKTQAQVLVAKANADANAEKQRGYLACPACAQVDILHALPQGVTVFAPGAGTGLPLTSAK